ncbi:MAG: hypothetical protein C0600_06690 [Ignavibacteria bacterium]|nr:MAG: hypothetical protein C0600_06690 [Ignavibacteria bacterium]
MIASAEVKRSWIDPEHTIPILRQCEILDLPRSTYYYTPRVDESDENLRIMHEIDRIYTDKPFYGYPRITQELCTRGLHCNHKRVARLMRVMGLAATVPGPHTSRPSTAHPVYPYLLRGKAITVPDQAWCADITYVPLHAGFMYLVAVLDWFSRYVLAWALSTTLDAGFCLNALREALLVGRPEIFNTDQGRQFTCDEWLALLHARQIRISMDGRGRFFDNIFVERFWRTLKYEEIYLKEYADGRDLTQQLQRYMQFYNTERRHSMLGDRTPRETYLGRTPH